MRRLIKIFVIIGLFLTTFPINVFAADDPNTYSVSVNVVDFAKSESTTVVLHGVTSIYNSDTKKLTISIIPVPGYQLTNVYWDDEDQAFTFYYDKDKKVLKLDDIDTTVYGDSIIKFKFTKVLDLSFKNYAILTSDLTDIETAVERELGEVGIILSTADTDSIDPGELSGEEKSRNNVPYKIQPITISLNGIEYKDIPFYVVEDIVNVIFGFDDCKSLYIIDGTVKAMSESAIVLIPADLSSLDVFGPYAAGIEALYSDSARSSFTNSATNYHESRYRFDVLHDFYTAQVHLNNRGNPPNTFINWLPLTLIQDNALILSTDASSSSGSQPTNTWKFGTFPDLTLTSATQDIFFGNDQVTISIPSMNGKTLGHITSISTDGIDENGYSIDNDDNTISVTFNSDFYDTVSVPITIDDGSDTPVNRNLVIHRVGVNIVEHDYIGGNMEETVFHGTQFGSKLDFSEYGYIITASYNIPDFGSVKPYGLYVTRIYSDGSIETETITQSMESPNDFVDGSSYDATNDIYIYNTYDSDSKSYSGNANVIDYQIYEGANKTSAPVDIYVLVLKDDPTDPTFNGINFGSGKGVHWAKE